MKKIVAVLFAALLSIGAVAQEKHPELTPVQKLKGALVLAEAATALITGPIALPVALATGRGEAFCHLLEGDKKPSSYHPNADQIDQCPNGNWLRIIPFLKDLKD